MRNQCPLCGWPVTRRIMATWKGQAYSVPVCAPCWEAQDTFRELTKRAKEKPVYLQDQYKMQEQKD